MKIGALILFITICSLTSYGQKKSGEACKVIADTSSFGAIEYKTKPFDLDKKSDYYCTVSASMYRSKKDSAVLGFTILVAILNKEHVFTMSHEEFMKIVFEDDTELYLKPLPKEGRTKNLDAIFYSDQYFYFENSHIKEIMTKPIKSIYLVNEKRDNILELHPIEHGLGRGIAKAFGCLISNAK